MTTQTERLIEKLRSDAYYAYLDGRTARSRELNKRADKLAAQVRKAA